MVVGDSVIDRALCVRFDSGASYTGEELIELHLHGNPLIVDRVLRIAQELGARLASAGEFSRRAFVNGKLDLTQVEGLAAVIRSESEQALLLSQRQLGGQLTALFHGFRTALVRILGLLELELDFAEEGYALASRSELVLLVYELRRKVVGLLAGFGSGERLLRGPRILLAGMPNAGKSSLFNALLGFSRSLVSSTPGTTRDYIEERLSYKGVILHFIDSAGLRSAEEELEKEGIARAIQLAASADRVLFLIDPSGELASAETAFASLVSASEGISPVRVYTKRDLAEGPGDELSVSVFDRESLTSLLDWLVAGYSIDATASLILLTRRQFGLVSSVLEVLDRVDWSNEDAEVLSYELRAVLAPLDELTGTIVSDEILDEIFSSFCIGK